MSTGINDYEIIDTYIDFLQYCNYFSFLYHYNHKNTSRYMVFMNSDVGINNKSVSKFISSMETTTCCIIC